VVRIVKQVASALASTHKKGIVHRDLKPGNIYLVEVAGERDFVRVLDFGISKMRSSATRLTRTASIMGTPNYMSPEQAKGKTDDIDERTDQWALACIAWECLSGEGPFLGESVPSVLFQIVHEPPPSLLPKVAGLPPQVEDVLVRGLAKDKADRFPSVIEFATALEAALAGTSYLHSPTAAVAVPTMRFPEGENGAPALPKATTLTRTAGELDHVRDPAPARSSWVLRMLVAGAVVVAAGAILLLRSGSAPKSTVTPTYPAPAPLPPAPPAPPPKMEVPEAPEPQALPEPSRPVEDRAAVAAEPTDESKVNGRPTRKREGKRKVEAERRASPPPVPVWKQSKPGEESPLSPKPTSPRSKEDRWRVD
jgi:serine/threonine-protein kinase